MIPDKQTTSQLDVAASGEGNVACHDIISSKRISHNPSEMK